MFITDLTCISPQRTYDGAFHREDVVQHDTNLYEAIEPDYLDVVPKALLRRMGRAVRMGTGAGLTLTERNKDIDGVIIGTANGGLEDCIKFLNQIVQYSEGKLTPTNFVQSTPNSVAGNLALLTANTGYNNTHVNMGLAFESALLDAKLLLDEGTAHRLLVGSVEEISGYNYNIDTLKGCFKKEIVNSENLLLSNTPGSVTGEGASMFIMSDSSENAFAEIVDVAQVSFPQVNDLAVVINRLLNSHQMKMQDVDAVILGRNGDNRYDHWYDVVQDFFPSQALYVYKNLVGEYPTASGFATWLASNILQGNKIPSQAVLRSGDRPTKNVLIYNQYYGKQHGLILLRAAN